MYTPAEYVVDLVSAQISILLFTHTGYFLSVSFLHMQSLNFDIHKFTESSAC